MASPLPTAIPPQTIKIKRKKDDDPVQALYIENAKRRKTEFYFRLQHTEDGKGSPSDPSSPRSPRSPRRLHHATKPGSVKDVRSTTDSGSNDKAASALGITLDPAPKTAAEKEKDEKTETTDSMMTSPITPDGKKQKPKPTPIRSDATAAASSTNINTDGSNAGKSLNPEMLSPGTKTEIRRFHLSKRVKIDSYRYGTSPQSSPGSKKRGGEQRNVISVFMEGSGRVTKKRSMNKMEYVKRDIPTSSSSSTTATKMSSGTTDENNNKQLSSANTPSITFSAPSTAAEGGRRRPRISDRERQRLSEARKSREHSRTREEADTWNNESDELANQLQAMVLDYISQQPGYEDSSAPPAAAQAPPALSNASSTLKTAASTTSTENRERGISGERSDGDAMDGDWVFDVYVRQPIRPGKTPELSMSGAEEEYGILVLSNSDDEQWWYDNDESDSDIWGSDEEDSNAEDYHTNDYPEEESDNELFGQEDADFVRHNNTVHRRGRRRGYDSDDSDFDLNDDADDEN